MIFKNPEPKNLQEWLDIATKGIAAAGKERITREIMVHYAEAVGAHLAQGEPEPVAQAKAKVELGDPVAAAKRFRHSCLTEEERQFLLKLLAKTGKMRVLLFNLLAPVIFFGFMFFTSHWRPSLVLGILLLLLYALPIVSFISSRRNSTRSKARLLLIIDIAMDMLVALGVTFFVVGALNGSVSVCVGVAGGVIACCIPKFRILNKGRKLINDIGDVQGLAE
jgi:hypothetical protein